MPNSYFISDLHLDPARPELTRALERFLLGHRGCDALYILGDLFEAWIGDDDDATLATQTAHLLRNFSDSGPALYLMHGNRDFVMGEGFERASGSKLLPDPTLIDLYGVPTLLMHGDSLCTRDTEYMAFRKMTRDPQWLRAGLAKPLAERQALARHIRKTSKQSTAAKSMEIMDVTPSEVENVMRAHRVHRLIHGHTHRPAQHVFTLDGAQASRTVLGDWYEQGSVLRATPTEQVLERLA